MIKICGLTEPEALAGAVAAGADALGFVFAPSARQITPRAARQLCRDLPAGVIRVAVMRHPSAAEWARVQDEFCPDWLQTDAADFAHLQLSPDCRAVPVYRDGVLRREGLPEHWPAQLVFEGTRSGAGETADWTLAARIAAQTRLMLAGGLSPANVADAIRQVRPWGVDVSSGVETAPGRKDPARIAAFIKAARSAASPQP
jgi:phosphoribosylanthranilate isomerase